MWNGEPLIIGLGGVALFIVLLILGVRIAFAALFTGIIGLLFIQGPGPTFAVAGLTPYAEVAKYTLSVVPLFILMGHFAGHAGLTQEAFSTARKWIGHVPGGLAVAVCLGCAAFGAVCGSSVAAAALMGKTAIPEMEKYNYDRKLATGTVAAAGTIASMIPPSVMMVVYGIMTEQSIGRLFMAGIIPGILTAINFSIMISIRVKLNPRLAPNVEGVTWTDRFISLKDTWGILVIFVVVMGGLYMGLFTPTEAGGIGAIATFILAIGRRRLSRKALSGSLAETAQTTSFVFAIIVGILVFTHFLALSRVTFAMSQFIIGLHAPPLVMLWGMMAIYIILGMFLDGMGMLILTIPVFFPAIVSVGFNPIWFGILIIKIIEIGMITPPVGMTVYVLRGITNVPLHEIFRGVIWFVVTEIATLAILVFIPQLTLWLPSQMR